MAVWWSTVNKLYLNGLCFSQLYAWSKCPKNKGSILLYSSFRQMVLILAHVYGSIYVCYMISVSYIPMSSSPCSKVPLFSSCCPCSASVKAQISTTISVNIMKNSHYPTHVYTYVYTCVGCPTNLTEERCEDKGGNLAVPSPGIEPLMPAPPTGFPKRSPTPTLVYQLSTCVYVYVRTYIHSHYICIVKYSVIHYFTIIYYRSIIFVRAQKSLFRSVALPLCVVHMWPDLQKGTFSTHSTYRQTKWCNAWFLVLINMLLRSKNKAVNVITKWSEDHN